MTKINLTTNYKQESGTDNLEISSTLFDTKSNKVIISLEGKSGGIWNGYVKNIEIEEETAITLISYVNTADFSGDSFKKQLIQWLIDNEYLNGSIV